MLRSSILLTFGLILAGVSAEYVWTGTEWKWNEPGAGQQIPDEIIGGGPSNGGGSSIEGSGGGNSYGDDEDDYEEDYDDEYNYDDDDDIHVGKSNTFDVGKTNNKGYTPVNTGILPATDDEDMIDGSGAGDINVGSGYDERVREPVTQTPRRKPEVIVDEEDDYDDSYSYDDDDEENYDDNDIDFGGDSDYDSIHNIDVQVTAKPTPFAYPAPTEGTTTRRPTNIYTDAPEVHKERPANRPASFFAQPGILAAVIGGAVVGLLCAILLVMFIVYRMRKKDEGSYALDEPKRSHNVNSYSKPPSREFYA